MDFITIKARIQTRLVDVPDAISVELDEIVNRAIKDAEDDHNFKAMRAKVEYVTTLADHRLPDTGTSIPTDWKESRGRPWRREGEGGILGVRLIDWAASEEDLLKLYRPDDPNDIGAPQLIYEADTTIFEVYPAPDGQSQWNDGEYRVTLPYWKYFTDLSDDADTNWFTENMDEYIIDAAVGRGFLLNWDEERAGLWLKLAQKELRDAKTTDKKQRLPRGMTLVPKMDVYAPTTYRRP